MAIVNDGNIHRLGITYQKWGFLWCLNMFIVATSCHFTVGAWDQVKSAVAARADLHCRHLDPVGTMVGGYWRRKKHGINGHSRILKWRYVSTIFLAIFCGDIP